MLQGPEGVSDVRVVNSYPSKVSGCAVVCCASVVCVLVSCFVCHAAFVAGTGNALLRAAGVTTNQLAKHAGMLCCNDTRTIHFWHSMDHFISRRATVSMFAMFALLASLLTSTVAQSSVESTLSVESHTVSFNYMLDAWVLEFGTRTVVDGVVLVQVCEHAHTADTPEQSCSMAQSTVQSSVVLCSTVYDTLRTSSAAPWVNTMLTADTNSILCANTSLAHKQSFFAQSHDWLYVTTPLQIVIPYKRTLLAQHAQPAVDNTYTLVIRLCIVQFTGTQSSIVSLSVFGMALQLHEPAELASESLVENVCVQRGLRTPRHGMLVPSVSELGNNMCTVRCNWRFVPVPWNRAASMQTDDNAIGTGPEHTQTAACIPLPPQFSAVTMHIQLSIAPGATAMMLPLSTLDAVDELAATLQTAYVNSSHAMVVCRVPHSLTAAAPFEFVLQKFATETANDRLLYEVRQHVLAVVDDGIYAECLFIVPDILEPHRAADTVVDTFRRSQAQSTALPEAVQALGLGDGDVHQVSRLAQVFVPQSPRIPLSMQRIALVAVAAFFVLTSAISASMRL